jgi:4-hydroxybenzoate polyprenyltransferase
MTSEARPGRSLSHASTLALFASVSRVHIVAIAVLGLLTFGWLFTRVYSPVLAMLCGLDWLLVNLWNRVVDLPEDEANQIRGTSFVATHRKVITMTGIAVLVGSLIASVAVLPAVTALRIVFHGLGVAYNWPVLPRGKRLKELYFWKNTASAIGFMLTVFGYPIAAALDGTGAPLLVGTAFIALCASFFFPFELSYEVIYDLRDVHGDAVAGARTYPVVHGVSVAERVIDGLLVASAVPLVVGFATDTLPLGAAVMIVAPVGQAIAYRLMQLRGGVTSAGCIALTWLGAAQLFLYHVWIALRLPGASV